MLASVNTKQTSVCLFYFIKSLLWYFKLGIMKKKGKKESNSIDLAYIADVSVLTNSVVYMRTLSLRKGEQ